MTVFKLPYKLIQERYFTSKVQRAPFVQQATIFQDVVIRCVRYAFAEIPASIGKVFFSKGVALPFIKFRMLRHGFLNSPIYWKEVKRKDVKGIYVIHDETQRPDIVVYYCHGGGFSMGSAYFYLEFLIVWVSLLKEVGYANPALFALEYTLVPDAIYPTQVQQTLAGYKYVLSFAPDPSRICVSGDSAGATLILSLLLCLSDYSSLKKSIPGAAVIISPWAAIVSPKNQNTRSDYLNAESLLLYGRQYVGKRASSDDPLVSPGRCKDLSWLKRASPTSGWFFIYGAEEVFAPETKDLVATLKKADVSVKEHEERGWVHAWPVVKLFLCNTQEERLSGLRSMVQAITERIKLEDK